MSKASKKSHGGAAKGPSTREPEGKVGEDHGDLTEEKQSEGQADLGAMHDPQAEHVEDMKEPAAPREPEVSPDGVVKHDPATHVKTGDEAEDALHEGDQTEEVLCQTVAPGVTVNKHPLKEGTVIKMTKEGIHLHRSRGVGLKAVGDDSKGEVYDVSEPYEAEEVKEKA